MEKMDGIGNISFTITQRERLSNLGVESRFLDAFFETTSARDAAYRDMERQYARAAREGLGSLLSEKRRTVAAAVTEELENWLMWDGGFTKVQTPTILPYTMLDRMNITAEAPLREQVFDLGTGKCLRPMLAPGLYVVMRELRRITGSAVRIFETGSCFRKDSQGAKHMNEFTMLNFVELAGVSEGEQMARLEGLARAAMAAVGLKDYELVKESSAVYGETLDVVCGGLEVASGAYGPHALDDAWGIFEPWVGIGFGIERLAMALSGFDHIKHVGRSLSYLGGFPLSV